MAQLFLFLAVAATLLTAFAHSFFGEKRLIQPIIASKHGVMMNDLAQQVIRMAWHLTTLLWIIQAWLLLREAMRPESMDETLILVIGLFYVFVGLFDAIVTRGKHIGWPLLTAIGVFSLLSLI